MNDWRRLPIAQQGMTLWSLLYVLLTLGLLGMFVLKSAPVYLNAYEVQSALDKVAATPALREASADQLQAALQKHFDAGYVDNVRARNVTVTPSGGQRRLDLTYEVRRPLLFNLSMVYSFDARATIDGRDE